MASMWRRAMVYLGLQDDDEHDYGGEYEPYGDYADDQRDDAGDAGARAADDDRRPTAAARPRAPTPSAPQRRPRTAAAAARAVRPGARPGATTRAATSRRRPSPAPVAWCARSARPPRRGCTSSSRTGFNDAQEVGDRLKANQPVILNLQGLPRSCSGA